MLFWVVLSIICIASNVRICFGQDPSSTEETTVAAKGASSTESSGGGALTEETGDSSGTSPLDDGTSTVVEIDKTTRAPHKRRTTLPPPTTAYFPRWIIDFTFTSPVYEATVPTEEESIDRSEEGKFKIGWYRQGHRRSVVRLWGTNLPEGVPSPCYGVLLNWRKVLTTCSCVCNPVKDPDLKKTIGNHPNKRKKVTALPETHFEVSLMNQEHNNTIVKVKVLNIAVHPHCDNLFELDYALMTLVNPLPKSKLAWVPTAEKELFNEHLTSMSIAELVIGRCDVPFYYSRKKPDGNVMWKRRNGQIHFQHWMFCEHMVCPPESISGQPQGKRLFKEICRNEAKDIHKYCMSMLDRLPLCQVPSGTPVFCKFRSTISLVGLLSNQGLWCSKYFYHYGVMQGLSDALPWIERDLSVIYSPEYAKSLTAERRAQLFQRSRATTLISTGPCTFWIIVVASGILLSDLFMLKDVLFKYF